MEGYGCADGQVGGSPALILSSRWQLAPGVAVLSLAGHDALFCEAAQKLYALDAFAAVIARRLADAPTPFDSLIAYCVRRGMDPSGAADAVAALVTLWSRADLLAVAPPIQGEVAGRFRFDLAGMPMDVSVIGDGLLQAIDWPALAELPMAPAPVVSAATQTVRSWQIRPGPSRGDEPDVIIAREGRPASIVPLAEAVPTLKARLVDNVLRATDRIALHAAALVRRGRALLLSGEPGAGKSTLATALTLAGLGYAGDDIALLDGDAMVQGIAFHPTLKRGSWDLLPAYRDALSESRVHRRADGAVLRYLPMSEPCTGRYPVGWIALLDRGEGASARIDRIEPLAALEALLKGAFARTGRSTLADIRVLSQVVSRATCWRLSYENLDQAVELLDRATRAE